MSVSGENIYLVGLGYLSSGEITFILGSASLTSHHGVDSCNRNQNNSYDREIGVCTLMHRKGVLEHRHLQVLLVLKDWSIF